MGYQQQVWGVFAGRGKRSLWTLAGIAATHRQSQDFAKELRTRWGKKLPLRTRSVPLGTHVPEEELSLYTGGVLVPRLDELCARLRQSKEDDRIIIHRTQRMSQDELLRRCKKLASKKRKAVGRDA